MHYKAGMKGLGLGAGNELQNVYLYYVHQGHSLKELTTPGAHRVLISPSKTTSIQSFTELLLHRFGSGVGPIHLSSVSCVGFERSLFDCSLTLGDGEGTCSHGMDVGIECSKSLRREGGQRSNYDRIEKVI